MSSDIHLSQEEILMFADGELSAEDQGRAAAHLVMCWRCRSLKQELEEAIWRFAQYYQDELPTVPSSEGPRARLMTQLERSESSRRKWSSTLMPPVRKLTWTVASTAFALALLLSGWLLMQRARVHAIESLVPNRNLTPGTVLSMTRTEVCRQPSRGNKQVSKSLQEAVFSEYGVPTTYVDAYEVDYLITPALGGADDIHNLWPESARTALWNAKVKDALEDRLRDLVCNGDLDLATAQHEIATNWIETYKKYFRSDQPVPTRK